MQSKLFVVESPKQSKPLHDLTIENSGNVENLILYTFDCLHCKMGGELQRTKLVSNCIVRV